MFIWSDEPAPPPRQKASMRVAFSELDSSMLRVALVVNAVACMINVFIDRWWHVLGCLVFFVVTLVVLRYQE